jgi:peptidoglycan/xylan/chitin deacetylase (PgdA/CDA1 family)
VRLDRFITLNLMQPLRRLRITHHEPRITSLPILMYHSISDDPESGVSPYYSICTGLQRFREQMQCLKASGYCGVTLSDGLAWLGTENQKSESRKQKTEIGSRRIQPSTISLQPSVLCPRPAALTFDDGFRDFYTHAFPILQQHGFSATMYLPTAFIGSERRSFKSRECLTWAETRELHRVGIEFGSHTVHHPELVDLPWSGIRSEITDSKVQIENALGTPIKAFAYPYAFPQTRRDFVGRLKDLLMAGGYETCVTTQIGRHRTGADPLEIKRLPVNSEDDDKLFQAKLAGGYDWLALPQTVIKKIKRRIPGSDKRNGDSAPCARSGEPALGS